MPINTLIIQYFFPNPILRYWVFEPPEAFSSLRIFFITLSICLALLWQFSGPCFCWLVWCGVVLCYYCCCGCCWCRWRFVTLWMLDFNISPLLGSYLALQSVTMTTTWACLHTPKWLLHTILANGAGFFVLPSYHPSIRSPPETHWHLNVNI